MRALNIGGTERGPEGWETFDINLGADYQGDARDPGSVVEGPFDVIYSSHCFEHIPPEDALQTLKSWRALTAPGGELFLSVPDIKTVAAALGRKGLAPSVEKALLSVIYGGRTDEYDVHVAGYTWSILENLLCEAGWRKRRKVEDLGWFKDTSSLFLLGRWPVSLNVRATNGV